MIQIVKKKIIIVSRSLFNFIERVEIDKERKFTPCHALKRKKVTYPDHYAIIMTMKNIPRKKVTEIKPQKVKMWNKNKSGGWVKYNKT